MEETGQNPVFELRIPATRGWKRSCLHFLMFLS